MPEINWINFKLISFTDKLFYINMLLIKIAKISKKLTFLRWTQFTAQKSILDPFMQNKLFFYRWESYNTAIIYYPSEKGNKNCFLLSDKGKKNGIMTINIFAVVCSDMDPKTW